MAYRDPRCVMVADSIEQADIVAAFLGERDIRAQVMNRHTRGGLAGFSMFAHNGVSIDGMEVWVLDIEQAPIAIELLAEQEMKRTTRETAREISGEPVIVVCEDCGTEATFPPAQRGSVQECPNCSAYIDVGDDEEIDATEDDDLPPSDGIQLPSQVRPAPDE